MRLDQTRCLIDQPELAMTTVVAVPTPTAVVVAGGSATSIIGSGSGRVSMKLVYRLHWSHVEGRCQIHASRSRSRVQQVVARVEITVVHWPDPTIITTTTATIITTITTTTTTNTLTITITILTTTTTLTTLTITTTLTTTTTTT